MRRGQNESYGHYESRFDAQLSKFNSLGSSVVLSDAMAAVFLLANGNVDSAQRISILAAAAPSQKRLSSRSSHNDSVKSVIYKAIAAVLCQCDQPITTDKGNRGDEPQNQSLSASPAYAPHYKERSSGGPSTALKMILDEIRHARNTRSCSKRGKFGHLYNDHNADGSLPAQLVSSNKPIRSETRNNNLTTTKKKPVALNNGRVLSAASNESLISSNKKMDQCLTTAHRLLLSDTLNCAVSLQHCSCPIPPFSN